MLSTYTTGDSQEAPLNVHLRCVHVAPQLLLVGAGGSVPGYRNGAQCWDSFPYPDDNAFAADLAKVMDPVFREEGTLGPTDAVILMTHNGPDQSSEVDLIQTSSLPDCYYSSSHTGTTLARADPPNPVTSGSAALYTQLASKELVRVLTVALNVGVVSVT